MQIVCIDLYQLKETYGLKIRGFSLHFFTAVGAVAGATVAAVKKEAKIHNFEKKGKPLIQLPKKDWIYSAERKYVQHIFLSKFLQKH